MLATTKNPNLSMQKTLRNLIFKIKEFAVSDPYIS